MISGFNPFNPLDGLEKESFDYRLTDEFRPEKVPSLDSVCLDATREISEITAACLKENPKERVSAGNFLKCLHTYLYTRAGGLGVTSEAISSYLRFFSGKQPSFELDSIALGRLRREAEDKRFRDPIGAETRLIDFARKRNFNLSNPYNASRTFVDAFGTKKVKSALLSLLSQEDYALISGYSADDLIKFLKDQDPMTNKEIHAEIARQALRRTA